MRHAWVPSLLLLAACGSPGERSDEPARPRVELTRASDLPERHRELLAAYGRGGEDWEVARREALADPELERFLVDNLVIEMVRAWSSMAGEIAPRSREAFERAQGELARLGPASVDVLAGLLGVRDGVVSQLAARTLERIGRGAVAPVAAVLADSDERETRRRAAELLESLPHGGDDEPAAQAALAAALADDPEWIVRAQAARALGVRGARDRATEPARRALERALSDGDATVELSAAEGLAQLGDPLAVPALIGALERAVGAGDVRAVRALERGLAGSTGERERRDLAGWRSWWYDHRDALLKAQRGG